MFNLKFLRRRPEVFGLDIGSSSIKAVQLHEVDGGHTLTALGVVNLPPDVIADGTIKDAGAVSSAIREAVERAGITSEDAAISICGRELIIKKVQIPAVPAKELADAVQLEAEHHIPFAVDEVFIDYHVVSEHDGNMDLILVAVKQSKVTEYLSVVDQAALNPMIVDVDSFALGNQFEVNVGEVGGEAVALIDVGASIMKTNVVRGGATIFARDIPFGGNQYKNAIAQRL